MLQSNRTMAKYIYDLPYKERMDLCRILDQNDKWEILGGQHMNFDMLTIQSLRRESRHGRSPTDELLTRWGHQNHTILELFVHLSKMQHYQAMMVIKKFVDSEYHRLIYEGEANISRLFKRPSAPPASELTGAAGPSVSKMHPSMVNFNQSVSLNNLPDKMEGVSLPCDTESKILNVDGAVRSMMTSVGSNAHSTLLSNHNNNKNNSGTLVTSPQPPRSPRSPSFQGEPSRSKGKAEMSMGVVESVGLPMIPFKELEAATQGWEPNNVLGRGGFGTVYKGLWKNTPVAVKRTRNPETDESHSIQMQQILGELRMLNSYRHDNILPLYGYSVGGEDPCLIYQFMPNGSLEDRLFCRQGTPPLSWGQRLNIAVGTARGLQFLHTINEKPLIHGDIKSANILLDSNFKPKIGDFGLAREGPNSHYTHMKVSRVHGTRPYLPDEFLRAKKFSTKVDTHSFGVVLFELGTGLRAYDAQRTHKFLRDLIENSNDGQLATLMDKKAGEESHTFSNLLELGKCCVSRKPKDRPEMVLVLQELEGIASQRNQILRTQQLLQRNSLTPTSPYELQLFHDHQRSNNVSPVLKNAHPLPETNLFRDLNGNSRNNRASPRALNTAGSAISPSPSPDLTMHGSGKIVPNIKVIPTPSTSEQSAGYYSPSAAAKILGTLPLTNQVNNVPLVVQAVSSGNGYQINKTVLPQGGSFAPYFPRNCLPTTVPTSPSVNRAARLPLTVSNPPGVAGSSALSLDDNEDEAPAYDDSYLSGEETNSAALPIEESHYSGIIPLISVLGIKKNQSAGEVDSEGSAVSQSTGSTLKSAHENGDAAAAEIAMSNLPLVLTSEKGDEDCRINNLQQDQTTSTKSKPLWILGESG